MIQVVGQVCAFPNAERMSNAFPLYLRYGGEHDWVNDPQIKGGKNK